MTIGFNQEQQAVLSKFYQSKQKEIQEILCKLSVKEAHYHDLEWRFEVIVSVNGTFFHLRKLEL